jgi:hypothetical protein
VDEFLGALARDYFQKAAADDEVGTGEVVAGGLEEELDGIRPAR